MAPGTVLAGKYRVDRIIGQGGMGLVVEAHHIALDERVALKFLLPDYAQHPEASVRFHREARAAAKIKSEHVARVSDVGMLDTGAPYMVMEFLEGRDLSQTLEVVGVLSVADALDYIIQACEAIAEAHSLGIVHRDLKPANLFLSKRPDGSPIVKVLDFGISKISGGGIENLTKTMMALGSALYMSPEQMQQTRAVDHRTDIYALGIALYELLAGKQPYYAETLPQLCAEILTGTPTPLRTTRPDIPEQLAQVVEKAYARDRAARFQSIADFVVALAPFAPTCSQTTIERVARMAGLPLPIAGERASSPPLRSSSPEMQGRGGTQILQQTNAPMPPPPFSSAPFSPPPFPPPPFSPATAAASPTAPMLPRPSTDPAMVQPLPRPSTDPNQIVPGPYSAPMSARAAASFAQGPPLNEAFLAGPGRSHASSLGRTSALIAAIAGILVLGALAAAFALRVRQSTLNARPAHSADVPPAQLADTSTAGKTGPPATPEPPEPPPLKPPELTPPESPSASAAPPALSTSSVPSAPSAPTWIKKGGPRPPGTGAPKSSPSANVSAAPKPTDIYGTSH